MFGLLIVRIGVVLRKTPSGFNFYFVSLFIYLVISACICISTIPFVLLHVSFVAILYNEQIYLLKLLGTVVG